MSRPTSTCPPTASPWSATTPTCAAWPTRRAAIDHLTAAELRRIDLGYGQGYCSLAEALDGFPDVRFNIDIKIGGAVHPDRRGRPRRRGDPAGC